MLGQFSFLNLTLWQPWLVICFDEAVVLFEYQQWLRHTLLNIKWRKNLIHLLSYQPQKPSPSCHAGPAQTRLGSEPRELFDHLNVPVSKSKILTVQNFIYNPE